MRKWVWRMTRPRNVRAHKLRAQLFQFRTRRNTPVVRFVSFVIGVVVLECGRPYTTYRLSTVAACVLYTAHHNDCFCRSHSELARDIFGIGRWIWIGLLYFCLSLWSVASDICVKRFFFVAKPDKNTTGTHKHIKTHAHHVKCLVWCSNSRIKRDSFFRLFFCTVSTVFM